MRYRRRVENRKKIVKQELKQVQKKYIYNNNQIVKNHENMKQGYTGIREMKQAAILAP